MADWNVDKRQNERTDALTNLFNDPIESTVEQVRDLQDLRRQWSRLESIPCFIAGREAAADHSWPGLDVRTLLSGDNSTGRLSYHDIVVAPGAGLPAHRHEVGDTFIYVVEGAVDLTIGRVCERSEHGALGYAPARTTQAFHNVDSDPARLLVVYAPAGADRAFADAHRHWTSSRDPHAQSYLAILSRYGFNFDATGELENDRRTNEAPQRVEYQIDSLNDWNALRDVWGRSHAVPKLIHSFEVCPRIESPLAKAKVIVTGDESAGSGVMFHTIGQPGYGAGEHFQPTEEEAFYILDGHLQLTCGSKTMDVGPGAFGFAPRGATHGFLNTSDVPVTMITMNTPAGHERGFEMIKRETEAPTGRFEELFVAHGWRWRENVPPA